MKAEMIKLKISSVLTRAMCKHQLSIKEVATLSGVAQHRVSSLLNPSDTTVDLVVLCKVCDSLRVRVTMRSRPKSSTKSSNSDITEAKNARVPPKVLGRSASNILAVRH